MMRSGGGVRSRTTPAPARPGRCGRAWLWLWVAAALAACGGSGDSDNSIDSSQAGPSGPAAPSRLVASARSAGEVELGWVASPGAAAGIRYRIVRDNQATPIGETAGTQYTDSSVAAATTYRYVVQAVDAAGRSSAASNGVSVTTPAAAVAPTLTMQPADLTVKEGESASFSVTAAGAAPLAYRWFFGTTPLASCTTPTCALGAASQASAGSYSVEVSNGAGSVKSRSAVLRVTPASSGTVVKVAGCAFADVKRALDSAPADATIEVGAGDCTWPDDMVRYGSVHLKGSGIGKTTVHVAAPVGGATTSLLTFNCSGGNSRMELSGFSFVGIQQTSGYNSGVTFYSCRDFRIHDNEFRDFKGTALAIDEANGANEPDSYGVIYANRFIGNLLHGGGYGVAITGGNRWPALQLGERNSHAVFVEDNHFEDNRHSVASNYGARYVFRHNTITNTDRSWGVPPVDAHGVQGAGETGTRSWEVYGNTIRYQGTPGIGVEGAIKMRGGDGVIFDNTVDSAYGASVVLRVEWYGNGDEYCNGASQPGAAGPYPADWLGQPRQAWIWSNTWGSAAQKIGFDDCGYYFAEGRDYFQRRPAAAELGYEYRPFAYPHPLRTR